MAQRKAQQLRIIGGKWRGRKLSFPDVADLRPTPDRVRETLFNWLQAHISGAHCLDLFAGSGALGLEALSRGAASVQMVEYDHDAVNSIHQHLATLAAENGSIVQSDALAYLKGQVEKPCDIVFLDPPFKQDLLQPCIELLEQGNWLADPALIYIEADKSLDPIPVPDHWQIQRSKTAGQVGYHLAIRCLPCDDDGAKQPYSAP